MKILVIGASGKTGQKLLAQLSQTSHETSGLIRSVEQKNLVKQFNAMPLPGDLEGKLDELVKGFDAIIFVAGSRGKNVEGVDYQGLVTAVDAAVKANIKRFLYIGSINTGKLPAQFIEEIKTFYQNKHETVPENLLAAAQKPGYHNYIKMKELAEKHLISSGINYTILRAGLLTQEPPSGKVSVTSGTLHAFGKTSRENIAQCFIEALTNENTYRKIYTILDGNTPIQQIFNIENR